MNVTTSTSWFSHNAIIGDVIWLESFVALTIYSDWRMRRMAEHFVTTTVFGLPHVLHGVHIHG